MKQKRLINSMMLVLAGAGLAACGGGGGGGGDTVTGTESTTVGTITGFGSIYVNGIEFETGGSRYRVDDEDAFDDSALAVGMKVKITGTIHSDGRTGTASSVYYDDDIEGPIDAGSLVDVDADTRRFTILGVTVTASAVTTVYDDGATFASLAEGQKLEVSGYFDGTTLLASRIELQDDLDNEYEIKGTVSSYDGSSVSLTLQNGATAGPYPLAAGVVLDIPADPTGMFVELRLVDDGSGLSVIRIEADDDDLLDDDAGEVSVRGVLADDGNGGLLINGIPLVTGPGTEYEPASLAGNLAADMEVKVEGRMQDGTLLASEVEAEHGSIEIAARVISVSATDAKNGVVTLDLGNGQSLDVHTDNGTRFEDDSSMDLNDDDSFDLDELLPGSDFLAIEAYADDTGALRATGIEREGDTGDTRLEAPLDAWETDVSITLLGIRYEVGAGTRYELHDTSSDAATFFGSLDVGDTIKVRDSEPDGSAEEVDLED